jgi:hypothetical protein
MMRDGLVGKMVDEIWWAVIGDWAVVMLGMLDGDRR